MRIGNNYVFKKSMDFVSESDSCASMRGVCGKTILLLLITIATAIFSLLTVKVSYISDGGLILVGYILSPIITFILSITMSLTPKSARFLSIPYAIFEGLSIGSLSLILMFALGGKETGLLLGLALLITITIFLIGAILYTTGIIKVTSKFTRILFVALIGLVATTTILSIISIFSTSVASLYLGDSNLALLISIVSIVIASLYTVISFDNANSIVRNRLDKTYEWYASFGIILNIIWLFYEILRVLLIILSRSRNN